MRGKNLFFKNINVFFNVDSNLDISPRGWCALGPDGRCRQKILIFDPCQVFTRVRGKNYVWKNIQMIFKFRLYFGHRKRGLIRIWSRRTRLKSPRYPFCEGDGRTNDLRVRVHCTGNYVFFSGTAITDPRRNYHRSLRTASLRPPVFRSCRLRSSTGRCGSLPLVHGRLLE